MRCRHGPDAGGAIGHDIVPTADRSASLLLVLADGPVRQVMLTLDDEYRSSELDEIANGIDRVLRAKTTPEVDAVLGRILPTVGLGQAAEAAGDPRHDPEGHPGLKDALDLFQGNLRFGAKSGVGLALGVARPDRRRVIGQERRLLLLPPAHPGSDPDDLAGGTQLIEHLRAIALETRWQHVPLQHARG